MKEKKVIIGKLIFINVFEDKNDMFDLDIDEELFFSEMDDVVEDL